MKKCAKCGKTENLTKHHIHGNNTGPFIYLCQVHHDEEHGIQRKENMSSFKRRIQRAKRRIKRDTKIIEEAEANLRELVEKGEE